MRKPGTNFGFQPVDTVEFGTTNFDRSPKRRTQRTEEELRQSFYALVQATTFRYGNESRPSTVNYPILAPMPRSRTSSFGDDDLQILSSQTANMTFDEASHKSPLQSIDNPNVSVIDLSNSPLGKPTTAMPTFGHPTQLQSQLPRRKEPNVFIPRKAHQPEHHRDLYRTAGPLKPRAEPKKAPLQMFSSMPSDAQSAMAPPMYSQPAQAHGDQVFYTDPSKASADLKALLEGGIDEDDDDEDKKGKGKDGEEAVEDGTFEGITVKLLPHQIEGVEWMRGRELGPIKRGKLPKGGILADDMGLGKTLQTVGLIVSNRMPEPDAPGWKKHFEHVCGATLVVAPLALIRQWEAEIKDKVAPERALKVCVHHGPQRAKDAKSLARYDVVITTYQILVSEHGNSSTSLTGPQVGCFGVHWFRVVLDEAHSIKNRNAKATKACCALRAEYRWCLTGTPMQNNLDELQSLVHFLRVQPYDHLPEWRAQIDAPLKNGKGHIAIRRLHTLLRCFMKRRTKDILKEEGALVAGGKKALDAAAAKARRDADEHGDEEAAVAAAVPKPAFRVTERRVITVATEFSPAEQAFYDALQERADASLERMMKGKVNYANALVLLLRLRQACNHPRLAETKLDKDRDALATDTAPPQKQQQQQQQQRAGRQRGAAGGGDTDVDALADALGGMGIQTRQCDMCLGDLSPDEIADGHVLRCTACAESVDKFKSETAERKKVKHKGRRVSEVRERVKIEKKSKAKARSNRKIITDSDDEDDEEPKKDEEADGSWLVPEEEQGSLHLGKAGGEDDEDAEGGGDDIGSEDSDHSSEEEDDSRLSSFVVDDDEEVKGEPEGEDDEGDTFVSVSKIRTRVVKQQHSLRDDSSEAGDYSDAVSEQSIAESELGSDFSDSSEDDAPHKPSQDHQHEHRRGYTSHKPERDDEGHGHVMVSAKIRELMAIIGKEVAEHKFIVFSQFTSMLDLIEPFFRTHERGFKCVRYDGKMANDAREAALHALRNDRHTRILLCSLKCGSLGLNLTAATRVVLVEPFWNPFVEEQAIDRVHRLTQTVDVVVYKLTVAGTVEERILELQDKKRLLAEAAIEGGMRKQGKDALKLGLQEILELFRRDARDVYDPAADGFVDPRAVAQDLAQFVRKKPAQKKENDVYGRRW